MQKIVPHLWFDTEARQAAELYTSLLPNSKIHHVTTLKDTPSGDADIVSFTLAGYSFMAISAGPHFTMNPSISFMVNFDPAQDPEAATRIDRVWNALAEGGKILMPLGAYPFSERYGWVQDRWGVSWQLILTKPEGEPRPVIIPSLLYVTNTGIAAKEATDFYLSVFKNSTRGALMPNDSGGVMFTDFMLEKQWFAATDGSSSMHQFAFNEGVSLMVQCETQEEIDYYWSALSAHPENEQCGWLKDKFGVSWQITPVAMGEMMANGTPEQVARVTQAFLPMKKFDIATLQAAFEGK